MNPKVKTKNLIICIDIEFDIKLNSFSIKFIILFCHIALIFYIFCVIIFMLNSQLNIGYNLGGVIT